MNVMTLMTSAGATEVALLVGGLAVLLGGVFLRERASRWLFVLAQLTLVIAALLSLTTVPEVAFNGLLSQDPLARLMKIFIFITSAVALIYGRVYMAERKLLSGEFYVLVLLCTLGMATLVSAHHLLTIYLGLELMSLSLYALVAINRDSSISTEAAMKYFVMGALASSLLLYGISLVYGATGQLDLSSLFAALSSGQVKSWVMVTLGLVFVVAGLAFKLGVVPFHMWVPDVYQGAPSAVTLFLSVGPKIAAFGMLLRILVEGAHVLAPSWQMYLFVMALLSISLGNVVAIAQKNLKRMLAYSAIAHMGYLMLGVVVGLYDTTAIFVATAYASALFYILSYALMSALAFAVLLCLTHAGFEAEEVGDFSGLNQRNPYFAAVMAITMLSMAGVPFFVGFFAKFLVLQNLIISGVASHAPAFVWAVVWAVMFSLIGAYYYLRIIKVMYFDKATNEAAVSATFAVRVTLLLHASVIALLGIFSQPLLKLCTEAIIPLLKV